MREAIASLPVPSREPSEVLIVRGQGLTIDDVARVSARRARVHLTEEASILRGVQASCDYVSAAVEDGRAIYGVTTGFGGMADTRISGEEAADLQNNALWLHKCGAGRRLPAPHVRGAMLLRLNSHLRGASGIRLEFLRRLAAFLNEDVVPHVYEFGSIGASGDLVPLTYITGAITGADAGFKVDFKGEEVDAVSALERLGLPPLRLRPKEGLAMINGTSAMTSVAAHCVHAARELLAVTLGVHALAIQALQGTNQSFHPFIHALKPHAGQRWAAASMLALLDGGRLVRDELDGRHDHRPEGPIQDRYSLRCLPQYLGPLIDGLAEVERQVTVEINSATDNPLIDPERQVSYHGGNFLGEYVAVGMDRLRHMLGLAAKHLDTQIALLVAPEFSNGLPASLVGNGGRRVNMGLKGLQLTGNSIMPILTFYGNSLADRFPTHAEQYNQNINSQGFGSANLTSQAVEIYRQYLAVALIFGAQAVDLRTHQVAGHYDARATLSPSTRPLYEAIRRVVGSRPTEQRPYVSDDDEQSLDGHVARLAADLAGGGLVVDSLRGTLQSLKAHCGGA